MEGILSKPSAVDGLDAVSVSSEQLVTILVPSSKREGHANCTKTANGSMRLARQVARTNGPRPDRRVGAGSESSAREGLRDADCVGGYIVNQESTELRRSAGYGLASKPNNRLVAAAFHPRGGN